MSKFIDLVKSKVGCGYVLGSQGQIMSEGLLKQLSSINTADMNRIAQKWLGKQCFDCSGLIIWALQQLGLLKSTDDLTADGIYHKLCTPIERDKLHPNDLVFVQDKNGHINHVGIYIGNSRVVQAQGTQNGVTMTALTSNFNVFGSLKCNLEDDMDINEAIDILVKNKIIQSPSYWKGVFDSKQQFNPDYVEALIKNMADYLKLKGAK